MSTFFGVPTDWLALGTLALLMFMLAALGLRAWRWPIFFRLGLRQLPRRPQQTVLIVAGLMLSTALVTASLVTGDTITHALRMAAVTELGQIDEVITYSTVPVPVNVSREGNSALQSADQSQGGRENNQPPNTPSFFSAATFARLADHVSHDPSLRTDVAALSPAIRLWCTIVNATSRQTSNADVVGIPPDINPVFGELVSPTGDPLLIHRLRSGEAYLNDAAARALAAKPGDVLTCTVAGVPQRWTVASAAAPVGLGRGSLANIYVSLDGLRESLGSEATREIAAPINQIWIANRGNAITSAERTERVVSAVRPVLVDQTAIDEIRVLLDRPDTRAALASRRGALTVQTQRRLGELLEAIDQDAPVERVERLLRNVALRRALLESAATVPDGEVAARLTVALQAVTGYRIEPIKQRVLEFAERAGNVITTIFLLFSLLSIAASVLLVFLIFSLLAASRRSELGVTRALGTERGHLIAMFTYEGVAYAAMAVAAGVPVGLGVSRALLAFLIRGVESGAAGFTGAAERVAETVTWYAEPRSVLLGATVGMVLTVGTVAVAAWRVSRLTIVTAIRDLPEPAPLRGDFRSWWWVALALIGAFLVYLGLHLGQMLPFSLGISSLLLSIGAALRHGGRSVWGREPAAQAGATLAGAGLVGYWALPFNAQHELGLPRLEAGIEIFALASVLMVVGAVWAIVTNGAIFARSLSRLLTWASRPAPAFRLAIAHLFRHPLRTGLTATMFGLVIFMLTVMQAITTSALQFHASPEVVYGGWHLSAETRATAQSGAPRQDATPVVGDQRRMSAYSAAEAAEAVVSGAVSRSDLTPLIEAAGTRTSAFFALLQLSAPSPAWGGYVVAGIDHHFAAGNRLALLSRARAYASDQEVWEAVAANPGLAVVDAQALPSPQLRGSPTIGSASFVLHGVDPDEPLMDPVSVWIGNPTGQRAAKVQVIGVVDGRVSTAFRGLYVSQSQLEALGRPIQPPTTRLYFRLRETAGVEEARAALGTAFFADGLQTTNLLERFQNESGPLLLASRMLQLFVGLGLFVGVASLGVISTRAALERRQEIGILRAIGFSRSAVAGSVLAESGLMVVLGSTVGVGLGLILCRNVFAVQFFDRFQRGMQLVVPWHELAITVALACGAALVATWLPARQASRVPPIAALREG